MLPFGALVTSWTNDPFSVDISLSDGRTLHVTPVHPVEAQETLALCKRASVLVPLEQTCRKIRANLQAVGLSLAPPPDVDGMQLVVASSKFSPFVLLRIGERP